jgi:subtilisin family serine protease
MAAAAALGACAGDPLAQDRETRIEPQQVVAPARFARSPLTGPIHTAVVPRAADPAAMTVVAVLDGPSVADLQAAAARKLTRAEKAAIKAQRIAEQAAPRARIEAAGGAVIGSFQSALNGLKVRIPRDRIAALRAIPGVVDVKRVVTYSHDNFAAVQRIQAPFAWSGVAGVHGEAIKIAIIDTGIDYTHADFGGPGTPEAFQAAAAASTLPADPALFGPAAPKIKGGIDLVGDAYDASAVGDAATPVPDPNPLDCTGHGSHVAGTAAGFGVLADGTTYRGPYDQLTHGSHSFAIGPGVAPLAELYAVRVFGCTGTTDVIAEALEWAVDNDMDVANLSLAAAFGTPDSSDAVAADSAAKAGVVVVAAAGNDGDIPYVLSSPGASSKAIAVAAAEAQRPSAELALPAAGGDPARAVVALDANAAALPAAPLTALVLRTGGDVSLGCDPAEFVAQGAAGKLVIVQRGDCGRVLKVSNGQQAGAAAVVMINTDGTLPPFEGPIPAIPDAGIPVDVTIPFLGVRGPAGDPGSDGAALVLRDGAAIAIRSGALLPSGTAVFSSGGPRTGDAALKPDITAPGEGIVSTLIGSGTQGTAMSGTSMATPLVAGTAALVLQAHPRWKPAAIKSAILNGGNPDELTDYATRRAGAGTVNAAAAVATQAYAFADRDQTTLNFGLAQFTTDFTDHRTIRVKNDARTAVTFDVAATHPQGSPHQIALGAPQLTVPARGEAELDVAITVPAATAGNSDDFRDVAGLIAFTPTAGANRGVALRVPYYGVPRVSSNVSSALSPLTDFPPIRFGLATLTNAGGGIPGTANLFTWGLHSPNERHGRIDLRAAGVQAFDVDEGRIVIFAINTFRGWSSPETQELDVLIDSDGDGAPDFDVFNVDFGLLTAGVRDGQNITAIFNLHTGAISSDFVGRAPTDASTIQLAVLAPSIGITPDNPRFSYTASAFDLLSTDSVTFAGTARYNAFSSAVNDSEFVTVPPGDSSLFTIRVDSAELALTPARGWMVISEDNQNGPAEAQLLALPAE